MIWTAALCRRFGFPLGRPVADRRREKTKAAWKRRSPKGQTFWRKPQPRLPCNRACHPSQRL